MKIRRFSFWAAAIVVGCNGKLTAPDTEDPNSAGAGGQSDVGVAGRGDTAAAGHRPSTGGHAGATGVGGHAAVGAAGHGNIGVAGNHAGGTGGHSHIPDAGSGGVGVAGWRNIPIGSGSGPVVTPGTQGQPCIPGGLVTEAAGSPAKTQIENLPRCYEGLSCNSDSKCVPTPDCPQNGLLCVVRHAVPESGEGGAGGSTDQGWAGLDSGGGSSPLATGGSGQRIYLSTEKSGVTAITASESRVYWVEYGTRDALGNYQHDGALLAYSPDDGTTTVIASGLEGPTAVEITTSHAYVYVDGAQPIDTPIRPRLLRVPLTGGSAELVQDGAIPASFAADGGRAFWSAEDTQQDQNLYSMTSDTTAVPTAFVSGYSSGLTVDGSDLYYRVGSALMRSPIESAAPVSVNVSIREYVLRDDSIYGLESINGGGAMLSRTPKTGGETLRVRALGYSYPLKLRRLGDRYFVEAQPTDSPSQRQLLSASFVGNAPPVRLIGAGRGWPGDRLWAATANALYWSEGRTLYKQPLTAP